MPFLNEFNLNALSAQSNFCVFFNISLQRERGIGVPLITGPGIPWSRYPT